MPRTNLLLTLFGILMLASPAALAQGEADEGSDTEEDDGSDEESTPAEEAAEAAETAAEEGASEGAEGGASEGAEGVEEAVEAVEEAAEAVEGAAETATDAVEGAVEGASEGADATEEAAEAATEAAEETAEAAPAEEEGEDKPEVRLTAEAGAVWLTGNTRSITANGAVNFGIAHKMNKFGLVFGGSYGRGVAAGDATNTWVETAKRIYGDARYDRVLVADVNSIYVTGGAVHDPFAGFDLRFTAGAGYAHQLVNTDVHNLAAEAGFNYTRDEYVDGVDPNSQNFAGARVFLGYRLTPTESFGFAQSVEGLFGGTDNQDAPFDGRLLSNTEITAQISKIFGIKLGFLVNWDFQPPEGFAPVDTTASVTLVATLL